MNLVEEIKMQIAQLNMWTKAYDEGHPMVSDKEWDDAYFRLAELEKKSGIYLSNSPTQKIDYQVMNKLEKSEHSHPMLSLDKTKDIEEVRGFLGDKDYIAMLKMDGLTCSLTYRQGRLVKAETRGNGIIGEDVTHNAFVIRNIPKILKEQIDLEIDGEVVCTYGDFLDFNKEYKNPRNFAAGSIRLLDNKECEKRKLSFVAWDCISGLEEETVSGKLIHLFDLGFSIVPFCRSSFVPFDNIADELKDIAEQAGYPIDGLIFKFDDVAYGESLGRTDHHFKNAIAYKFYDEEYETRLKYIEWSMGRTGVLTPIAVFEPIDIDGTIVERASLHNYSVMQEIMGDCCYCGQKINVYKANMIIPQISSAVKMKYGDVIMHGGITVDGFSDDYGVRCPICEGSTSLVTSESGTINLVCNNPNCEGKLINIIDHFVGKKGLDVKGLSKATIEKLINNGWLNRRADVFKLYERKREWEKLPGFGIKSVSNILTAIEGSKNTNFEAYLSSLGIPLIGRTVSKELSKTFSSYNDFRKAIEEGYDFTQLEGFGYEMNKALREYDYTEADEIAAMLTFKAETPVQEEKATVAGMNFVITGKLSRKRDDIAADIERAGGKVTGSVSGKTNYLVCNDKNSNTGKSADAKRLGIPVITEEELMNILS